MVILYPACLQVRNVSPFFSRTAFLGLYFVKCAVWTSSSWEPFRGADSWGLPADFPRVMTLTGSSDVFIQNLRFWVPVLDKSGTDWLCKIEVWFKRDNGAQDRAVRVRKRDLWVLSWDSLANWLSPGLGDGRIVGQCMKVVGMRYHSFSKMYVLGL